MRIIFFFLLATLSVQSQQELGTYFFSGIHQSAELNPSFDADHKLVVSLPSIYMMGHQRGISVNSAVQGQLLDFVGNRRNQLMFGTNLSMLKVSYKHKNVRYNFAHNYRLFSDFQFGNPLVELIARGNSATIGGTVSFTPSLELTSYSETVIGAAFIGNFSIGANVKFLNGIQNFYTERSDFELAVNDDIYQLQLKTDFLLNSSFPIDLNNIRRPNLLNLDVVPRNYGVAFDIGMSYKNGPLRLAASAIDLGFLSWNDNVHNYETEGSFVYNGADFDDVVGGDFNFLDTIGGSLDFQDKQEKYSHFIPAKFYGNVTYAYSEKVNVGALIYGHQNFNRYNGAVAFNLQRHWNNKHALAIQYAVVGTNPVNIGLSGFTTLGPIQLYGIMDNVVGLVNTFGAENLNFKVGMNLVFNRKSPEIKSGYAQL